MFSRRIFIDIYIAMFMGLTLLFFALAERYPARRRLFLVLMYVSIGLGVLTQGPVAAVVPAIVFLAYLLARRELRRSREMMIPLGTAIVLAIVVPWYAVLYMRHGWTYIISFFLGENLAR
jgi:4-amino-4-deoxy-L-arabinose transferase-like glycosyltransferase